MHQLDSDSDSDSSRYSSFHSIQFNSIQFTFFDSFCFVSFHFDFHLFIIGRHLLFFSFFHNQSFGGAHALGPINIPSSFNTIISYHIISASTNTRHTLRFRFISFPLKAAAHHIYVSPSNDDTGSSVGTHLSLSS